MRHLEHTADVCVVGGGLAGICTALSAARHGLKTVLMQDRSVLGGNASEEVRMWVSGAHGKDNRETGILEELVLENFYLNPARNYSVWSTVLYSKVMAEKNITLLLDTACMDAETENGTVRSVTGYQSPAQTFHRVEATYFADCSGDSVLAPLTHAHYRYGREARDEFGESIAPVDADKKTMGMSILFQIRETDHKVPFKKPDWAYTYETDSDLPFKDHVMDPLNNFWWIEVGGEWDALHDTDRCREELQKIAYGVWDHLKNHGDHGADNWELEWIGSLPGKRESIRYVGLYTVTENDVSGGGHFDDVVAYGGWTMDDHFPQGFYYDKGCSTIFHPAPSPWGIPLRCMISDSVRNLVFAGRNISVTHTALSSSRVMATCALLGQAIGTALSITIPKQIPVEQVDISQLQQQLMHDDCYLPYFDRTVSPAAKAADCPDERLKNGKDRGEENLYIGELGTPLTYRFSDPTPVDELRIVFDSDLNRTYKNMPCRYPLEEPNGKLPSTLICDYDLILTDRDGKEEVLHIRENRSRLRLHPVGKELTKVTLLPLTSHGDSHARIFSFEPIG